MAASSPAAAPKAARKPRPQLGTGAAWAADGRLWWVGVRGVNELVLQRSEPVPSDGLASGKPLQWQPAQVLDTGADPISADGENHPKLLLGPDGAGLKLQHAGLEITLITPHAPLGRQLLGQGPGDQVQAATQAWQVLRVE